MNSELPNPYQSPAALTNTDSRTSTSWKLNWPIVAAVAWAVASFFYHPFVHALRFDLPFTIFVWCKIVMSGLSLVAVAVLLSKPTRWWKLAAVPPMGFLVWIEVFCWRRWLG
jgi:hypothetical protein